MLVLYNVLLALIGAAALAVAGRGRAPERAAAWLAAGAVAGVLLSGLCLSVALEEDMFAVIRLAACCTFLHTPLVLGGVALLYWKTSRRLAIAAIAMATALVAIAVDA